jgi:prolyl oligopeptidase PreP (S9A serine peptidase family)
LQEATADHADRPILLFQAGRAGHGVGKPASKRAEEAADALAFFSWQLGNSAR